MIPQKLALRNFLSYREAGDLDLQGVQVACLCGDNGHGKSALLDAITWALWGWARGHRYGQGGNSPDELVHQGQSDMEVSLEFLADGATYRVLRKYSRGSRGRSSAIILDLQAASGDGYRSLAEGATSDTERRIQRLLRMDYDTFVNSAFLLQGQANRFTASTPSKRKETLAEILGLSLFERLEDRAREQVREREAKVQGQRAELERLEEGLSTKPEHEEALASACGALKELEPRLEAGAGALKEQRDRLQALELRRQEADRLRHDASRAREDAVGLEAQVDAAQRHIEEYRGLLARETEVEEGLRRWRENQERLESLEAAQARHDVVDREKLRLEHQVAQERAALEGQLNNLQDRIDRELAPRAERASQVEEALSAVATALAEVGAQESRLQVQRSELQGAVGETERLGAENTRLMTEMQELRQRLDMLGQGDAQCPLCGTPLGADGLEHLQGEIDAQGQSRRALYLANQKALEPLARKRQALELEVAQGGERVVEERRGASARQGSLERELQECNQAKEEIVAAREGIQRLQQGLERGEFAQEVRSQLAEAEAELKALSYDPAQHQEARAQARALEPYVAQERQLNEARERLPQEEASLGGLQTLLEARRRDQAEADRVIAAIAKELEELPAVQDRARRQEEEMRSLEGQRSQLQADIRLQEARLEELERLASQKVALEGSIKGLEQETVTFGLLTEAFGKRGVQALLIEAALPELESEANQLLGRLTENRLTLTLETQRQTRRGDITETLEIRIADELGTRSYELFSGGEAFRIDFALRIALAKLLASRAGAPLRTLFLDEGFGTQDAGGRERLVDAIRSIQDDFDLILVITHIDELKEAFPVRIEVTKTEETGSTFQLVWS